MNQIAASFRIAGIIIATTTKVHSLASFGEYNAMSPAYCLLDSRFGEIWQPCKLRCFSCTNET